MAKTMPEVSDANNQVAGPGQETAKKSFGNEAADLFTQQQANRVLEVADKNHNGYITIDEITTAINNASGPKDKKDKLEPKELQLAENIRDKYGSIADLSDDQKLWETQVHTNDLKTHIAQQPEIQKLKGYFDQEIQKLVDAGKMDLLPGRQQTNKLDFIRETLAAMATGDKKELGLVLDRYSLINGTMLDDWTKTANEIAKAKGGMIVFHRSPRPSDNGYSNSFTNVVFPLENAPDRVYGTYIPRAHRELAKR